MKNSLSPLNPYAISKMKFEKYLINNSKKQNFSFVILRYFNVAGSDKKMRTGLISKHSTHLIKVISEVATNKRKKLVVNGNDYDTKDGTAIRDYIHVSDLSEIHLIALRYLINNNKSQIFNCGYGIGYSVKEIIFEMNKILKKDLKFKIGPRRPGDSEKL